MAWLKVNRPLESFGRLCVPFQYAICHAQTVICRRIVWLETDGLLQSLDCFPTATGFEISHTSVMEHYGIRLRLI
jgi:hypothetical protein